MIKISVQTTLSLTLAANLSFISAAAPAIGVALSSSNIRINDAKAESNASIFDGSTVETGTSGSRLELKNGANVQLSSDSRGKIFQHRLVLEKGNSQFRANTPFQVDTAVVKISGTDRSSAQVSLRGQTVQVASLTGTLKVVNASGVFVTTIGPGMSFDFSAAGSGEPAPQPPAGAAKPAGASGSSGTAGAAGGAAHPGALVVAGVVVVGGVVGTATYFGTQGVNSPQSCLSPCQSH